MQALCSELSSDSSPSTDIDWIALGAPGRPANRRTRRRQRALARRRPQPVPERPLTFEPLEQRFLLSADFFPGLADGFDDLLGGFGDKLEEYFYSENANPLTQTKAPGLLQVIPVEGADGTIVDETVIVPTIGDLLRAEVVRGPDGKVHEPVTSLDLGTLGDPDDTNLGNIVRYLWGLDEEIEDFNPFNPGAPLFGEPEWHPNWPTVGQAMAAMDLDGDGFVDFTEVYRTLFMGAVELAADVMQNFGGDADFLESDLDFALGEFARLPTVFNPYFYVGDNPLNPDQVLAFNPEHDIIDIFFGSQDAGPIPTIRLDTSIDSSSVSDNTLEMSLTLSFDFEHAGDQALPVDLGRQAAELEIDLRREVFDYDENSTEVTLEAPFVKPVIDVFAQLALPMTIIVELPEDEHDAVPEANFGLRFDSSIVASVSANKDFAGLEANVGFLGTILGFDSTFNLDMSVIIDVTDPSSPEYLGFTQDPLPTNSTTSFTAQTALPSSLELQSPVMFEIKIGQNDIDPVLVSVPEGDYANRAAVRDAVQEAVDDAGFDGLLTIGLSADRLQFSLPSTNALPLGFFNQRFVDSGTLTANLDVTFALDEDNNPIARTFNTAFLLSFAGLTPRLVSVNTTVNNIDDLKDALQDALNDAGFTFLFTVFAGVDDDKLTLTGAFDSSLEITRFISLDAENRITIEELNTVSADYLFTATPAANDNFAVDFKFQVAEGIDYDPDEVGVQGGQDSATLTIHNVSPFSLGPDSFTFDPATGDQQIDLTFNRADPTDDTQQLFVSDQMVEFLQFNVVGASEVIGVLGHLKTWFERLPDTTLLSAYEIPFAEAVLGDLFPFAEFLQRNVLEDLSDPDGPVDRLIAEILDLDGDPDDPDDFSRIAAFSNAQELGKRLRQLGLMGEDDEPVYRPDPENADAGELTYDIRVNAELLPLLVEGDIDEGEVDTHGLEAPLNFEFSLPPVFDFQTDAAVVLLADGTFAVTLGLKLGEAGFLEEGSTIGPDTEAFDLRVRSTDHLDIHLAATGFDDVAQIFGRLTADATFEIRVFETGEDPADAQWVTVTVGKDATAENRELADLIADIDDALEAAGLEDLIEARAEGNRVMLVAKDGVEGFHFNTSNRSGNATFTELGLASGMASTVAVATPVDGVRMSSQGLFDTGVLEFFLNDDVDPITVFVPVADTAANNSLTDLVNDINAAIEDAFADSQFEGKVFAARNGDQLVFGAVTTDIHFMRIVPDQGAASEVLPFGFFTIGITEPLTAGLRLVAASDYGADVGIEPVDAQFARLLADETIEVRLSLGENEIALGEIEVSADDTARNTSIQDLVEDINTAIANSAELAGKLEALAVSPTRVALQATSGEFDTIEIVSVSVAGGGEPRIGFAINQQVETELLFRAGKDAPRYFGPGDDAEFQITIERGVTSDTYDITLRVTGDDNNPLSEAITNRSIFALVNGLNRELDAAIGQSPGDRVLEAHSDGHRLVILTKDETITGFSIHDANAAAVEDLKLYASASIDGAPDTLAANTADLLVYQRNGTVTPVDLSGMTTLNEVLIALSGIPFLSADIADDGASLRLEDTSAGANPFFVNSVNTSRAAADLGILAGGTELLVTEFGNLVIVGDRVGSLALSDRMFVRPLDGEPLLKVGLDAYLVKDVESLHPFLQENGELAANGEALIEARIGFLGVQLTGFGHFEGEVSLALQNHPDGGDWTLREMMRQLQLGFSGMEELLELAFELSGAVEFDVGFLPHIDLFAPGSSPTVTLNLQGPGVPPLSLPQPDDPTDPDFLAQIIPVAQFDVGNAELFNSLQNLNFGHILAALRALADYLGQFSQFEFLNREIPVLGVDINELLGVADRFARAVEEVEANPAGTIQLLEQKISESFNLPPDANVFALSLIDDGDMLKVGLDFSRAFGGALDIDLDLSQFIDDFTSLPDFISDQLRLQGSAGMETNGGITAQLTFGIDLGDPGNVFLFAEETLLEAALRAGTDNLSFVAALGPVGVSIINGLADFDIAFSFANLTNAERVKILGAGSSSIATVIAGYQAALDKGDIEIVLPVYVPDASNFAGDISVIGTASLVSNPPAGIDLNVDFDFDIDPGIFDVDFINFSLFDNMLLLIDGFDVALSSLQGLVAGKIFNSMPLIGNALANSSFFIEDFRNDVVQPFRDLITTVTDFGNPGALGTLIVQDFLFDVLSETTLLKFLDGTVVEGGDYGAKPHEGTSVLDLTAEQREARSAFLSQFIMGEFDFGGLDVSNHFVQWDFVLGQTFEPDLDFAFDIGIPALGLKMDADLNVLIGWELGLGMGLSFAQGVYIDVDRKPIEDTGDTTPEGFRIFNKDDEADSIPELSTVVLAGFEQGELDGRLGFLQVTANTKAAAFSASDKANPFGNVSGIQDDGTGIFASFDIDVLNRHDDSAARMGFMDLGGLDARIKLEAEAQAKLDLAVGFNEDLLGFVAPILPEIIAEFEFSWGGQEDNPIIGGQFSGDIDVNFADQLNRIAFNNIAIDLGSFLGDVIGPFVAPIQEFTEPLQPIIDIVTAPIPVLSDLAGKAVTLVDLAAQFGEFEPGFIYAIADIISLVNSIPTAPGALIVPVLDEFVLFSANPGGLFDVNNLTNPNFSFAGLSGQDFLGSLTGILDDIPDFFDADFLGGLGGDSSTTNTFTKLMDGGFDTGEGGFSFPIFEEPTQILGLLLGRDAELIRYIMAPFLLDFEAEMKFPIYGPLWGLVTLGLGMEIDLAFGYDTFGIRKFADGDFQNPLDLIAGFFFHDNDPLTGNPKPELIFSGSIGVGAELNAGVASAGVTANIILSVFFDLYDPNNDGKVRLDEIAQTFLYEVRTGNPLLAPISIFDVSGEVALQLKAFLKILFAKFSFNITPPIVLFEFSIPFEREPILATERGDDSLLLHIGPQAENRLNGDLRGDIGQEIFAKDAGSGKVAVWSDKFGVPESAAQIYNATSIVAFGGAGDDLIDLSGVSIPVEIYGGGGNDILKGGPGNDTIHGGPGDDAIFGDEAIITDRMIFVPIGVKDGRDVIYTGLGENLVFGGGNDDRIFGGVHQGGDVDDVDRTDTERNVIFGNGGRIALSNPGKPHEVAATDNATLLGLITLANLAGGGNNVIHGGEDDDLILGGSGNDLIFGHEGNDLIFGLSGFNIIFGGPGNDELHGGSHDDIILGGAGNDEIHGGRGNDTLFGDYGEMLRNSEGRTVAIRSEPGGAAVLTPDGGEVIEGSDGEMVVRDSEGRWVQIVASDEGGGSGNNTMFGTDGANIMFGGAGNDHMVGGPGFDIMFGGPGNDFMDGGPGSDFIFGDTGLVAYFDFASVVGPLDLSGHKHKLIGDAPLPDELPAHDGKPLTYDLLLAPVRTDDGNDYIVGGAGNNIVFGGGGEDTVFGDFALFDQNDNPLAPPEGPIPAGDDILFGDGGWVEFDSRRITLAQTLGTEGAADRIFGQGGNDLIFGGADGDTLHGDHDEDHKFGDDGSDIVVGDFGRVRFINSFGLGDDGFAFRTFGGAAFLIETTDPDSGDAGNDAIFGNGGNDILIGHEGDDTIHARDGSNIVVGDHGRVSFVLTVVGNDAGGEPIFDNHDDLLDWPYIALVETTEPGLGGKDTIFGSANDDLMMGGADDDTVHANAGNNVVLGDNGEVVFRTAEGLLDEEGELLGGYAFVMFGGAAQFIRTTDVENDTGGEDTVFGGPGDDIIAGGARGDEIHGNDGNNIIVGDNVEIEFDFASVFDGNPWPYLERIETEIRSPEAPNNIVGGADLIFGGMDDDIIAGGADGDEIHGNDGNNVIAGDNVRFLFVPLHVTSGIEPSEFGDDLVAIFGAALRTMETTDTETETGGADIIFGSPDSDIIVGGVDGDFLFGTSGFNLILGDQALLIWGYDPTEDGLADLVSETLFSEHAQPELGFESFEGGVTQLHIVKTKDPTLGGRDLIVGGPDDDVMAGGTDSDFMFGGPGGNNTMFGDHAVFYPQHSTHSIYYSRNFFSIDTGDEDGGAGDLMFGGPDNDLMIGGQGDDVMLGGGGHNDMIGGHNVEGGIDELSAALFSATGSQFNDIMFAGDGHSVMAGDNAIIWREEDFRSPRFWTLGDDSDLLYLLPGPGEEADTDSLYAAPNLGQMADDPAWVEAGFGRFIHLLDHDYAIEDELLLDDLPFLKFGDDVMAGGPGDDMIFGQLGNDIIQGDGEIVVVLDEVLVALLQGLSGMLTPAGDLTPPDNVDLQDAQAALDNAAAIVALAEAFVDGIVQPSPGTDGHNFGIDWGEKGLPAELSLVFHVFEALTDGNDYIEGGGGSDLVFGGLGQDDIIGGSSDLFGLVDEHQRPDGTTGDFFGRKGNELYGGAGERLDRNEMVGDSVDENGNLVFEEDPQIPWKDRHARDADVIMGNNANIFRFVDGNVDPLDEGYFLSFEHDTNRHLEPDPFASLGFGVEGRSYQETDYEFILVRAFELLDYRAGFGDTSAALRNGGDDLIFGESGDDIIHAMMGNDVIFGGSEDDDLYGGTGNDWISGGPGVDGILGADGLILTSRNMQADSGQGNQNPGIQMSEPLYGIEKVDEVNKIISTPGDFQLAIINRFMELKKAVQLFAFEDDGFGEGAGNDIVFGGWGNDFIHGGDGDDALSGAEALPGYFTGELNWLLVEQQRHTNVNIDNELPWYFDRAPFNPGSILQYDDDFRSFRLYDPFDPWRKVMIDAEGNLASEAEWVSEATALAAVANVDELTHVMQRVVDGGTQYLMGVGEGGHFPIYNFLLNFDAREGLPETDFPDEHPDGLPIMTDGNDRIFGDLGHDWIVGGTGRDHMWGGRGDDMLNMDDDHDTTLHTDDPLANNKPDPFQAYSDIAYGGAGLDILILNTGADRAIDWVGEFNSYVVPFSPFGAFQISRALLPHLQEFLYELSWADGADQTIPDIERWVRDNAADARIKDPDPDRNFEPYGEIGLVLQRDADWNEQTGAPRDPQPGNLIGPRDVMRREMFSETDPQLLAFGVEEGTWTLGGGVYSASADLGGEAVSLYFLNDPLPSYAEILVTVNVEKGKGGFKENAYIIFDYQDATNFKFAGISSGTDKIQIGQRTEAGWEVLTQSNMKLWDGRNYDLGLVLHGTVATVLVNGRNATSYAFDAALNEGYLGLGSDNSAVKFDDFQIQVLPPLITYAVGSDFSDPADNPFTELSGDWTISGNNRYFGTADDGPAMAFVEMDVSAASMIEVEVHLGGTGVGGVVFDYRSPDSYKVVLLDFDAGKILIGHQTDRGFKVAASAEVQLNPNSGSTLLVSLMGGGVSASLDGKAVLGQVYYSHLTSGDVGLIVDEGTSWFGEAEARTNDPSYVDGDDTLIVAQSVFGPLATPMLLTQDQLAPIAAEAYRRVEEVLPPEHMSIAFADLSFEIVDLPDDMLALVHGHRILVDGTAAGHGWFIDTTPQDDSEFRISREDGVLVAVPSSEAHGSIDLLTVLMHEVAHVFGFDHDSTSALMGSTLDTGTRVLPSTLVQDEATVSSAEGFDGNAIFAQSQNPAALNASAQPGLAPATAPGMALFDLRSGAVELHPLPDAARPGVERVPASDEDFTVPATPPAIVFDTAAEAHKSQQDNGGEEDDEGDLTFDLIRSPLTSGLGALGR